MTTSSPDEPLAYVLHRAARQIADRYGAQVAVELDDAVRADPAQRHALVRITREAVSNGIRHGRAERVRVVLTRDSDTNRLVVHDDGKGFDEETANEIQARAREHLEKLEAELDAKRKALGVADDLMEVPGLNTAMLVALGENGVKTVEDLADCATDDLAGWSERQDKETIRHDGFLDGFGVSRPQCEDLILAARVKAGWIDEADLAAAEEDGEGEHRADGHAGHHGADADENPSVAALHSCPRHLDPPACATLQLP